MAAENKKNKLKTSVDVYNRLLWDDTLGLDMSQIEIIHYDKNQSLKSKPFEEWKPIENGGDIPFHRIAAFKYNKHVLWDRQQRIDNINKQSGSFTTDWSAIQQSNENADDDSNDNINDDNETEHKANGNHSINEQDLQTYADPSSCSEYIADRQFLSLLKMEPKSVAPLYSVLEQMIDDAFNTQRPNSVQLLAKNLCHHYLSYLPTIKQHSYYLFGSSSIGLDTYRSDLDIKIIPNETTKISTRDQCIHLLTCIKSELRRMQPLKYDLKTQISNDQNGGQHAKQKCLSLSSEQLMNGNTYTKGIRELVNRVKSEYKSIEHITIKLASVHIADAAIPRGVVGFRVSIHSTTDNVLSQFKVAMDITVGSHANSGHHVENQRDLHLQNWVNKHCINTDDKRIHKYLFCVKLWTQHKSINNSLLSTINGYGWVHVAMFLLTHYYKQKMIVTSDNGNDSNEAVHDDTQQPQPYECVYSDICIPAEVTCSKLFVLFIDMLHAWICYDEIEEEKPEKIVRRGMNILTGEWMENNNQYTLFVLDPFIEYENLAKCVRHRRGIPLLVHAISSTVQHLQFAADQAVQQKYESIWKYIEFLQPKQSVEMNEEADECVEEEEEEKTEDEIKCFSFKQLSDFNLNMPKRKWIQKENTHDSKDETITICQFNCLAQELTAGTTDKTTFRCDTKYLQWEYRRKRILYEILQYKPDIICLCEVDGEHFHNFYHPNLANSAFKYDGVYLNKNNPNAHQTSSKRSRSPKDGVAIFWNCGKFSSFDRFECVLGKANKAYHVALGVRLKYQTKQKTSQEFDVWTTHLKAGRNNKAETWRLSQVNTLLYYMRRYSQKRPILFCGDLNSHYAPLHNDVGELVQSTVYPTLLSGEVKSKRSNKDSNAKNNKADEYVLQFESVWNDETRNTFSTWAGWKDRDVKCCLDYIMIGDWKHCRAKQEKQEKRMFQVASVLDVWDEEEIREFACKLPNEIYPSDHILIGAKLTIQSTE